MNDKREGTETAPDSVQRIIADLDIIDRRLAERLAAQDTPEKAGAIEKATGLLRAAVEALAPAAALPQAGEESGSAKRRVKIKAESEVTAPAASVRAGPTAKSAAPSAKSTSRNSRNPDGTRAARRPAGTDKASTGSLLARLGAAAEVAAPAPAIDEPPAEMPTPAEANGSVKATAERLARLEAEIADLTEAVTAVPTKPDSTPPSREDAPQSVERAAETARSSEPKGSPDAWSDSPDTSSDDDADAEIVIIGADGTPSQPSKQLVRQTPRIFREETAPLEEEAEVEIRGQDVSHSGERRREQTGELRVSPRAGDSGGKTGRWRLFRNSS